jgi:hypothetical protein
MRIDPSSFLGVSDAGFVADGKLVAVALPRLLIDELRVSWATQQRWQALPQGS